MRKIRIKRIKDFHNRIIEKYKNIENLKSLGTVLGMLNVNAFLSFVVWGLVNTSPEGLLSYFLMSVVALGVTGYVFIKSSVYYAGAKGILGSGISLIFTFPFGLCLFFFTSQQKYWELDIKRINSFKEKHNIGKFFTSSLYRLENKGTEAMHHLEKIDKPFMQRLIQEGLGINGKGFKNGNEFQSAIVLSMSLLMKQFKQENFDNFLGQPHGFDDVHFHFAIKNNKMLNSKNKYIYSVASIVMDEINNYQKLFNIQALIKQNLKFSPAKIIVLQWGDQYKVYINE